MNMQRLRDMADNPIWDDEQTTLSYRYPIQADDSNRIKAESERLARGIPPEQLKWIGHFLTATSTMSHIGPFRWAVDFLVPDGTVVPAARKGKIIEVEEGSEIWGDSPKYRHNLNYVTIQHEGGEFSQYCHLERGSVSKLGHAKGSLVSKCQPIAVVGKTGWTDRDHLHFIVFRGDPNSENPLGFKSLKVRFDTEEG